MTLLKYLKCHAIFEQGVSANVNCVTFQQTASVSAPSQLEPKLGALPYSPGNCQQPVGQG